MPGAHSYRVLRMTDHDAVATRALDWTDQHLDLFDLFDGARAFEMKRGQRVGELAILVHVMHAVRGEHLSPRFLRMVTLLKRIRDHAEFGDRVMRSPVEFVLFAEVYARLHAVGHDDCRMRQLVTRAVSGNLLDQSERVPHRLMDIRACLDLADIECSLPTLEALLEHSILAANPKAILMGEDDLYALTHVLMFLCCFGTRRDCRLSIDRRESLAALLGGLLSVAALDRHWDLLAELLICWKGMDLDTHPIVDGAWEALAAAQNEDGSIPGPKWLQEHQAGSGSVEPGSPSREEIFNHHYHTTLVSALAGMLWAARPGPDRSTRDGARLRPSRNRSFPASPTGEHVKLAARSAQSCLERVGRYWQREAAPEAHPGALVVLGLWLSHSIAHGNTRPFPALIREIGLRLIDLEARTDLRWAAVPSTLKVMVSAIFASEGVHVPYLHSSKGFLDRVKSAFTSGQLSSPRCGLEELQCLLRVTGVVSTASAPEPVDSGALRTLARSVRVDQGPESVPAVFEGIAAATRWGLGHGHVDEDTEWFLEMASGWCLHALRRYDLIDGAVRLRALAWCRPRSQWTRATLQQGTEFLLLQQRPDGDFGFLAPELRRLRETDPPAFVETTLRLSVTIESLWTLAEAVQPGWRLYSCLPRHTRWNGME